MSGLDKYKVIEKIFESKKTKIYRAYSAKLQCNVIIKLLRESHPSASELTRFKQEFDIQSNLNIEGVVKCYDVEKYNNTLCIILEDFEGVSISDMIKANGAFSIKDFLDMSVQMAKIIGDIHKNNIIHLDIKPHNMLYNSRLKKVKIIDFGGSTKLPRESTVVSKSKIIGGTYKYIAPEQTGFLNYPVDYRADLYSLGASFYHMITGKHVFELEGEMELINAHAARLPIPPIDINEKIPPVINEIILKLLKKNPSERYISAYGLYNDLLKCRDFYEKHGKIYDFEIGKNDYYDKINITTKVFGREHEIAVLNYTFERICKGDKGLMLLSGPAGIGKTSMIKELRKSIFHTDSFFVEGRFEKQKQEIPFQRTHTGF